MCNWRKTSQSHKISQLDSTKLFTTQELYYHVLVYVLRQKSVTRRLTYLETESLNRTEPLETFVCRSICWSVWVWHDMTWVWQSPKGKRVVTHWASMLRWIWSISEYNPTTRDSRNGPWWMDRLLGNVEGADLKNNSQSTTHVDL